MLILAQTETNIWISLSSGLIGAILGALIAALATVNLQHWRSTKRRHKEQKFKIYMLLHEAYTKHFFIASADITGEIASNDIKREYQRICWKIADEIRSIDEPETAKILYTMFSLKRFKNENDRAKAFEKLLDDMGKELNPNYVKVIRQISEEFLSFEIEELPAHIRKIQPYPWSSPQNKD